MFYLTRLQLALPPSAISLPRPSSPIRRQLVKANYPLPAQYQTSLRDEVASPTPPRPSVVISSDASEVSVKRPRGRDDITKQLSWTSSRSSLGAESMSTLNISLTASPSTAASALPITPMSEVGRQLGLPSPQILPSSPSPVSIPQPKDESRDHFDHLSTTLISSPPSQMLVRQVSGGRSSLRHISRHPSQRVPSGDEGDVRRMLQARINALVSVPSWFSHWKPQRLIISVAKRTA